MLHSALHPGFSRVQGMGVIARRDIPRGTALWWPCPSCVVVRAEELRNTPEEILRWLAEYGYRRADGSMITPCGGAFLFNHSCAASVLSYGLAVGIAVHDIHAGDEATCDYRGFRYEQPWRFRCRCGTTECVDVVESRSDALDSALISRWTERLVPSVAAAAMVPQETAVLAGDIHAEVPTCLLKR